MLANPRHYLGRRLDLRLTVAHLGRTLTVEDTVEIAVQVSGKTRSRVTVPRGADEAQVVAAAQGDAAVRRFTEGKEVRKVVYVPNRLLNLVIG